jgi:hypothetical protein
MKRLLPFIFIVLLFFINSCTAVATGFTISNEIGTAVAHTQTAVAWTAVPTPTLNPSIPGMIDWLNTDLSTANPLGWTLDAEYRVIDLSFSNVLNSTALIFQVDVYCSCRSNDCCIPERTFVVIVDSMKRYPQFWTQIPSDTIKMTVVCSDHPDKAPIGAVSASWPDVKGYLQGNVSGDQLGWRAHRVVDP